MNKDFESMVDGMLGGDLLNEDSKSDKSSDILENEVNHTTSTEKMISVVTDDGKTVMVPLSSLPKEFQNPGLMQEEMNHTKPVIQNTNKAANQLPPIDILGIADAMLG